MGFIKSMLLPVLMLFLCVNVGVLYYMVLFGDFVEFNRRMDVMEKRLNSLVRRDEPELPEVTQLPEQIVQLTDQQKTEIAQMAVAAMETEIEELVSDRVASELASEENAVKSSGGVKEYFVPFGAAVVKTGDYNWKDTSLVAEVDMGNYTRVKAVVFEVTMRVPSGNGKVEARLWNATDGYMVAGTELVVEGSEAKYVKSGNVHLASGKKTYKVQMRTSLDYEGVLDASKVKITVE